MQEEFWRRLLDSVGLSGRQVDRAADVQSLRKTDRVATDAEGIMHPQSRVVIFCNWHLFIRYFAIAVVVENRKNCAGFSKQPSRLQSKLRSPLRDGREAGPFTGAPSCPSRSAGEQSSGQKLQRSSYATARGRWRCVRERFGGRDPPRWDVPPLRASEIPGETLTPSANACPSSERPIRVVSKSWAVVQFC